MTLADVLDDVARELDGVDRRDAAGMTEWSIGGRVFAASDGSSIDVRLKPVVARAALGTPDTRPSARGEGWVTFAPGDLDRFALDRAASWFRSAGAWAGSDGSSGSRDVNGR